MFAVNMQNHIYISMAAQNATVQRDIYFIRYMCGVHAVASMNEIRWLLHEPVEIIDRPFARFSHQATVMKGFSLNECAECTAAD